MIAEFLHNLETVFAWVFEASWQASVLVVLVLLLQMTLRGRLNPRWYHALWLLVILRLVLPILPESALSLFQFTPKASLIVTQSVTVPIFITAPDQTNPQPPLEFSTPAYPFSVCTFLALVWLVGTIGLLILTWLVNYRFAHHVRNSPAIDDPRLLEIAAAAQSELGLHCPLRLIESAQVKSPAIMGLFHPTLIFPERVRDRFSDEELRFIFLHEFAHLKRGDLILQWLIGMLQILHWFNPVLWFAFRRIRADREPATDALVLSRTGEDQKEPYGQVLLKLLEDYHERHSLPTLVGILEDKDQFKHRFLLIGKFTRGAYGWSLLGVTLLIVLAVAGLTRANSENTTKPNSDAKVDFEIASQPIPTSQATQDSILHLLHELLVMRYINGTPDDIFHWQELPGTSVEQVKASGSFLHVVYFKKPSIPVGTAYSYQPDEVWIGLQDSSSGDCYPGYPAGILVVTSGKDGTLNLTFGSKSLLVGMGLAPEIFPHLSTAMQKSLEADSGTYQHYLDWTSTKDAVGQSVNQQVITAVQAGDAATLQKLIAQGVDITKIKGRDPTLLFEAASPEVANLLIQHGADVNAVDAWGSTALDSVVSNSPPKTAAITRVLLAHGADPNRPSGKLQMTPVLEASRGDTLDALVEDGADLKATNRDGYGVMFLAGRHDITYLQSLIRHGFAFDPKKDGPTIMVQATWVNNLPVIKWLLDHGVDPNAQGLWVHMKNGKDDMMFPLQAVVITGQLDAAKLLLDHGSRWNRATTIALQNHYSNIVKLLWDHGVRDISELNYAISQNARIVDLEKILQSGSPVDPPEDTIITPLGEAAVMDNLPAVELLVQHGADVNKGGNPDAEHPENRYTPLVLAAKRGQDEIVAYLLQHGAAADPAAVSYAALAGIPNSFYVGKDHLPSKEHYEQVIQELIDAGALKNTSPEWTGRILVQAISPCWGDPDLFVLQKLLAAGLSPEAPMPYLKERGEKPNSIIGYYRDYYAKNKDNPNRSGQLVAMKSLLDMLETADKRAGAKMTDTFPESSNDGSK
jgi:beta-lactamase regulating signal transducer with metallopeptidase domain/ankyrin repeat protein